MRVTGFATRHRLATSAIVVGLAVLGGYGLWRLPVSYLPEVTYPLVKVQIRWPAATAEEVEAEIADSVERLMATVDRLDSLQSSSREGLYALDVHFQYGADVDTAFQDVLAALTRAEHLLPDDVEAPFVFKADPSQLPVMQLTVSSDRWDAVRLRDWTDRWLSDRILAVRGVAGTEIVGGLEREIRVEVDPAALEKHRIPVDELIRRIAAENVELAGGRVTLGPKEVIARTVGEYADVEEIRSVVVAGQGAEAVRLGEIAEVVDSHEDVRVITRFNREECVKVSVLQEAEANTVRTADRVAERLGELAPELPAGLRLGVVEDQAVYVRQALTGVRDAAIAAVVLLVLVVYLFLGSARQVLVMLVALPLTVVLNFGLMHVAGFSLNIFSLGGLIVALGVVLDASLVVVETISRRRREDPAGDPSAQAVEATREVGPALVAATLSFLALFVPFLIVPGLVSLLFRELILVIAGIVVVSLAVAVTVTPMLTAVLAGHGPRSQGAGRFERAFARITSAYGRGLDAVLRRRWARWAAVAAFLLVLAGAVLLLGQLGGEFLPLVDDGRIMVKVRMPTGASVHETDRVLRTIEERLADDPRVESLVSLAGAQVKGITTYEIANEGQVDVQLVPRPDREVTTEEFLAELRKRLAAVQPPGGQVMPRQMPIKGIMGLRAADVIVRVRGEDLEVLGEIVRRTLPVLDGISGLRNVSVSMDPSKPELQIRVDRLKAAALGVSVADVAETLRSLITGTVATRFREGAELYDVRVVVPEDRLATRGDVARLAVTSSEGDPLRLADVADVVPASGPVEIIREDQVTQVTVEADVASGDLAGVVRRVRDALEAVERPPGYELDLAGSAELMAEMKSTALAVLAFALLFSFIALTVQFDSLGMPALILGSTPVCLAGGVLLMHATGMALGATVVIGVLVVVAATVNDGVLLLTAARDIEAARGLGPGRAVTEAAMIRLRPRVMTSVTTMVGFLPLALNLGEGGDMLQPMAVVAIGGLAMEIPVALLLMPCVYVALARRSAAGPDAARSPSPEEEGAVP